MKYTILGFSQVALIKHGLDLTDALILRWFIDFKDSGRMATEIVEEKMYYWIKYDSLLEDIPVIGMNNKDALRRRLKKMVEHGILTHVTVKEGGTFSFYSLGENYLELIEGTTQKSEGYDSKVGGGTTQKSEQKINLLKDKSIKDNYNYKVVIDYLNEKAGKNFKAADSNNKLIRARYNEGYTLDDFKAVIDYKTSKWKGTEWEQYLRPSTLFGNKFQNYLNEIPNRSIESNKTTETGDDFKNLMDIFKGGLADE